VADPTTPAYAAARDAADPLAGLRDRFLGAETSLVYFDGNSLGRPLRATADRLDRFVREEWGGRLIRGWDEGWFDLPVTIGDDLARVLLGAGPGQTAIGDSTTVLLYKLIRAAADHQARTDPRRTEIVIDRDNFPTDRYVVEGIAAERGLTVRWIEVDTAAGVEVDQVRAVVGPATGVVVLSQVAYRSSHVADAAAVSEVVHEAGGLVLWDLCHSAGAVPVELDAWGADLAVGCGYKYLNGGPGAPAFAYVAGRHQETLTQPIQGWMGAADPFKMGPAYQPAPGIRRFISGTPAVVGMLALRDMVALIDEAGMKAVRDKSVDLTTYAIDLTDAWLRPLGATVGSPREPDRRGGHVTVNHPRMREVTTALWDQHVLPDFRDPDGLRIGLSPLSTSFDEVRRGMEAVRATLLRIGG
jgi:kynureninase